MISSEYSEELGNMIGQYAIKGMVDALIRFAPFFIALFIFAVILKVVENAITKAISKKKSEKKQKKVKISHQKQPQHHDHEQPTRTGKRR